MLVQNFKRTKFYPRFVEAVRAVFGLGRRRAAAKQNSPDHPTKQESKKVLVGEIRRHHSRSENIQSIEHLRIGDQGHRVSELTPANWARHQS
jgi:hypothetical protein